ncbi:PREDICTED: non-structural maintenance of chromosomes element 1 homolog isoform X1 [Colobus angolensis palliatus]|uniref:non-structural maintenance of chromosomes element 1 homolog isoform X1 n=1 Tax=Colobus angolensis palliatus TaxID=336983 RepID=UPI0005F46033|nr:PREDICTED: non-structural maintenance of chromosomes element 1 homolog isoform X1 [Colobus angolensis palliatus]
MQSSTKRMGVMTDVHRRFLQLLMTHGVLEEWDVKRLQRHCYKVHDRNATVDKLEDFINNINSVLESLYIEIKRGVTEDDGRPIYALVNLATTSVSKMATDFAENELDLFRKALELIIDSETGFASSTNILNLVDQLKGKKMKKKEAEQVLQKFVQNKWLIEKEGEFTLHGRAILEMEQYIRETYPDAVKTCNICHSLLIQVPAGQGMGAHCWALSSWGSAQVLPGILALDPALLHCRRILHKSWWRPSPRTCQRTPPHCGLQGRTASLPPGSAVGV